MSPEAVEHALQQISLVVGIMAATYGLFKIVDTRMKRRYEDAELLKRIHAEVFPNHGSSLRDVVDRTERQIKGVSDQVDNLGERLDTLFTLITQLHSTDIKSTKVDLAKEVLREVRLEELSHDRPERDR